MTQPLLDDDKEPPLDAAQLRLQARLKRMLFISSGIMALGLIAVFAAILYRVYGRPSTFAQPLETVIALPAGAKVSGTRNEGNRLFVTVEAPGATSILVVDLETLTVMRRLTLKGE